MKMFARLAFLLLFLAASLAHADPLPTWVEGPNKKAILQFIQETTSKDNANFIPPKERIAVFDQDGTLWVEQPLYTQLFFALDSVKVLAYQHPEWQKEEPFKSIIEGNQDFLKTLTEQDIEKIVAATHAGMTLDEFQHRVQTWLEFTVHPRFKRPFTELVYQPMLEMIRLFQDNGFKTYIVSGGGQEFMRVYAEKIYGIPPEQIIGSTGKMKYEYQNGKPALERLAEILFIDDKEGKPEGINLIIGRRPYAAAGNSTGDQQMLEWTQAGDKKRLELLVHHDDAEREYAYGPDSKIGTFSDALMEEAKKNGWLIVSMKNDWKVIFPWQSKEQSQK